MEMPDVVAGEPVASDWGNLIRSRTVQRYADATDRDALVPFPAPGDLAYLDDTAAMQLFDGTNWVGYGPREYGWGFSSDPLLNIDNGGVANPNYGFRGFPGLGWYLAASDVMGAAAGGQAVLRIAEALVSTVTGVVLSAVGGLHIPTNGMAVASPPWNVRWDNTSGLLVRSNEPVVNVAALNQQISDLEDRIATLEGP